MVNSIYYFILLQVMNLSKLLLRRWKFIYKTFIQSIDVGERRGVAFLLYFVMSANAVCYICVYL